MGALAAPMTAMTKVIINVRDVDRSAVSSDEGLHVALAKIEQELGDTGRVLLRPSGTEPVVRVMVEAATEVHAQDVAQRLAAVVRERLAL